ncbi:SMODS domain-containing nucleotidyltransferase [Rhizobium sp. 'Codium 1']|uniref:SMODS domain-containing nucleotidyltransferase n=1 Tax=Rhizobium sp. 'Codium 1' TaxID=2940484 RepID=UPI001E46DEC8|nr:nucleotidyltransferase [Rhizobium sp. 'Codium 1']MCC8932152.1 nucleotidyltransferase [Rhizobium sp. 'Codium 1']
MGIAEDFKALLDNIKVDNDETISLRYGEITSVLNKRFRDTESKTANSLQVGSYGRWTAIRGISDLDMIYMVPAGEWDNYKDGKQYELLRDTKDAIKARYPATTVKVDRLVVRVLYKDFHIEVMPAFRQSDGSYKYPDTAGDGSWKTTKPQAELDEMQAANARKNRNLRRLCKMTRAWKNKHGVAMGGLLIDTLAYNFLESTEEYDDKSYLYYDYMCRDFFKYLSEQPKQSEYAALGSRQRVRVKKRFESKAKKAYELCLQAIEAAGQKNERQKWRKVFGNGYPAPVKQSAAEVAVARYVFRDTEEFVEDRFPVDVRYDMRVDCEVVQNGFRPAFLRDLLRAHGILHRKKSLRFFLADVSDLPPDVDIFWKVLNRGEEAERRDIIRGQILPDKGGWERHESSDFRGEHRVECYAVQNGVVIARDGVRVPISAESAEVDDYAA